MRRTSGGSVVTCAAALWLLAAASDAVAQGNGRGNAYGLARKNVSSSAPSATPGSQDFSIPGTGIRNFGSWLDDATVLDPRSGFVSIALSYWRTESFREVDVPVIDTGMAINRRIQFGVSAPIYHAGEPGAPMIRGLGDVYLSAKVQLREPARNRIGVAVSPVLEVLSAPMSEGGRLGWAVPVNVELQRDRWRLFGSGGYFSRGALFASAALEVPVSSRAWLTGSISQSHSMKGDPLSFALGLSKNRTDVSGSVAVSMHRRAAVFGSIGRTISRRDANAASVMFTTGVSVNFSAR